MTCAGYTCYAEACREEHARMAQRLRESEAERNRWYEDSVRVHGVNKTLRRDLTAAKARCAELERDAARYRFLRDRLNQCAGDIHFNASDDAEDTSWTHVHQNFGAGAELDTTLDAALAKLDAGGGEG